MSEEKAVVIVIDDDVSLRDALADLLRSVSLEVETFGSAREFLQGEIYRIPPGRAGC